MTAFYNEHDPFAAATLRELIAQGHIAPGIVDERSIEDIAPIELAGFTQVHLFAGFGVWSYAARQAGWPDDRPLWSASCPCQPFSSAGKGSGFDDQRHLWPCVDWLVDQCRPRTIVGEQVASKDAEPWLDLVQSDLEAMAYAFGAVAFPSAGIGAPHIRDRTYWLADASAAGWPAHDREPGSGGERSPPEELGQFAGRGGSRDGLADAQGERGWAGLGDIEQAERWGAVIADGGDAGSVDHTSGEGLEGFGRGHQAESRHGQRSAGPTAEAGELGRMGNAGIHGNEPDAGNGHRPQGALIGLDGRTSGPGVAAGQHGAPARLHREPGRGVSHGPGDGGEHRLRNVAVRPGPVNGDWRDADWLFCRDGKWRPVEPGAFPLAHGAPARVGRLRGYGNAINAEAARHFIEIIMEILDR